MSNFKVPELTDAEVKKKIEIQQKMAIQAVLLQKRTELPHLHGWKWYPWAREFFESQNKINLLCAANQISKSSTMIRKAIHWATDKALWPELWDHEPNQFWYLYPSQKQVNMEFETKWSQFLPKGKMKDDPQYGWKVMKGDGGVTGIRFHSGVIMYFKTYSQNVMTLQTGSVDALFCDEELPIDLYDELIFRLSSSGGYFHMVFTATLGQEFWRKAIAPGSRETENLPDAWKRTVSMYDCMEYDDGTPSHWTAEKISIVKARCKNQDEVLKRVYGKFIMLEGRKYEAFDVTRHMLPAHPLPKSWLIYCGADPGSGGETGHPAALAYIAVRPDFKEGRVFLGWRGDNIQTTSSDLVEKHIELKKEHNLQMTAQYYDWANKDFFVIASRMGETFIPADKSHESGEHIINVLFKNDMLKIYETDELVKLAGELSSLSATQAKRRANDDLIDAMRYGITKIPWDFSAITGESTKKVETVEEPLNHTQRQIAERRKAFEGEKEDGWQDPSAEFDEWNEAYSY